MVCLCCKLACLYLQSLESVMKIDLIKDKTAEEIGQVRRGGGIKI